MSFFDKKDPVIRHTSAPFEYIEKGKFITVQIGVTYKGTTISEIKNRKESANYFSDLLEGTVLSLTDPDGKVVDVTKELLENMDVKNLKAINKAINDDQDPK